MPSGASATRSAALTAKLKEVQDQLSKLEKAGEGENLVLSDKDRQAIEKFRAEMLVTRRELREVKRELRKDIDQLDGMLKFVNIAGRAAADRLRRRSVGRPTGAVASRTSPRLRTSNRAQP